MNTKGNFSSENYAFLDCKSLFISGINIRDFHRIIFSENTLLFWVFSTLDFPTDYPTFTVGREDERQQRR